jgi:hypothetical protein
VVLDPGPFGVKNEETYSDFETMAAYIGEYCDPAVLQATVERYNSYAGGYDADFCIFDLRRSSTIDVRKLHSKCQHSPYGGWEAVFPDTVLIRGELQVKDGEFCGERSGVDICG